MGLTNFECLWNKKILRIRLKTQSFDW